MIVESTRVPKATFEDATGWALKPEGACKGEVCVPLRETPGEQVDVLALAETLGMPVVEAPEHGVTAIGPETLGGRALTSAECPDIALPDLDGNAFRLSRLRGEKILIYAWAPY